MSEFTPVNGPIEVDLDQLPPDARVLSLYEAYPQAKADAEAAKERLDAITNGIKAELAAAMATTGVEKIVLRGREGVPLRLARVVQQRFDTKGFASRHPDLYNAFRKPSESWRLEQAKVGEE